MKARARTEDADQKCIASRSGNQGEEVYQPRTALGRRLMSIRAKIVASGEPLLNWQEIEQEVAERRGEAEWP
jgi:hypothetical protein